MYKIKKEDVTGSPQWGSSSIEDELWPTSFDMNDNTDTATQQQQQHAQPIRRSQRTRTRPSRLHTAFDDTIDFKDVDPDLYDLDFGLHESSPAPSGSSSLASSLEAEDLVDPSFEEEDGEEEEEEEDEAEEEEGDSASSSSSTHTTLHAHTHTSHCASPCSATTATALDTTSPNTASGRCSSTTSTIPNHPSDKSTQKSHGNSAGKRKRADSDSVVVQVKRSNNSSSSKVSKPSSGGRRQTKRTYGRACARCRRDHKACDGGRPCSRCAEQGSVDECVDVPIKPLGRPRKARVLNEHGEEVIAPSAKKQAKKPQRKSVLPKRRASCPTPVKKQIKTVPAEEEEAVVGSEPSSQIDDDHIKIEDLPSSTTSELILDLGVSTTLPTFAAGASGASSVEGLAETEFKEEDEADENPSMHIKSEIDESGSYAAFSSPVPMSRSCYFRRERAKLLPHAVKVEPSSLVPASHSQFYQQQQTQPQQQPQHQQPTARAMNNFSTQPQSTVNVPYQRFPQQQQQQQLSWQSPPVQQTTTMTTMDRQSKAEMQVKACTNPILMLAPLRPHDSQPTVVHVSEAMAALLHFTSDEVKTPGTCIIAPGFMHRFDKIADLVTRGSMNPYSPLVCLDLVFNTKIGYYLTSQAKVQVYYSAIDGECSKIAVFVEEWAVVTPQQLYSIHSATKCQADDRAFHDRLASLVWMKVNSAPPSVPAYLQPVSTHMAPSYVAPPQQQQLHQQQPPLVSWNTSTYHHMPPSFAMPCDESPPSDPVTSPTTAERSPPFSASALPLAAVATPFVMQQQTHVMHPSSGYSAPIPTVTAPSNFVADIDCPVDFPTITTASAPLSCGLSSASMLRLSNGSPSSTSQASCSSFSPLSSSYNSLVSFSSSSSCSSSTYEASTSPMTPASVSSWMSYPLSPADNYGYGSFTGILAD
eukprot:TRINITY_DN1845_c0_g1_i1.p1 TRINITY_DN1845_c0_g1~~TRINITY_DN1845_c0_g1_i1.p1  ORF type:complete len:925 (-),score=211.42 TRINITY_DN1845_c0_g1_i1:210-2984(-)